MRSTSRNLTPTGESEFRIVTSQVLGQVSTGIPADAATCADCLRELLDPADRRYRYPFHQLHQLRAAIHHHSPDSLRPPADINGGVSHVRRLPGGVRRSAQSPLSCAAQCLLGCAARMSGWSDADGRSDRRRRSDRAHASTA